MYLPDTLSPADQLKSTLQTLPEIVVCVPGDCICGLLWKAGCPLASGDAPHTVSSVHSDAAGSCDSTEGAPQLPCSMSSRWGSQVGV